MTLVTAGELAAPVQANRKNPLASLWQFRNLIGLLVMRELKVRYKRSIFGLLWTMLNPLLLMVVYTIVFTTIMAGGKHNFSIFLLAGLLPWIFFSNALMQGLTSVLGAQDLIRKIRLPQAIFPLSVVGSNLVNLSLSFLPLIGVMLVSKQPVTAALWVLPLSVVVLTVFTSGVTLMFASFTVFFRDVRHLTEVFLQILFYLTPVLYDVEQIQTQGAWWAPMFKRELELNPLSYVLPLFRAPIYDGVVPGLHVWGAAVGVAALTFVAGLFIFTKLEPRHIHHF